MQDKWANCIESVAVFLGSTYNPQTRRIAMGYSRCGWSTCKMELGTTSRRKSVAVVPSSSTCASAKIEDFLYDVVGLESLKSVKILMISLLRPKNYI